MEQDRIRERLEAMSDRELLLAATLRRAENSPRFHEEALRHLERRGIDLEELTGRARVRVDDGEAQTLPADRAVELLGHAEPWQTLSFASCIGDSLLVQREPRQWWCHFYEGDTYRGSFRRGDAGGVAGVLGPFLSLEPWEGEAGELHRLDDWRLLIDSDAVDFIESIALDLGEAGIPHTVRTPLFAGGGGGKDVEEEEEEVYAVLVPRQHFGEACDAIEEVEETVVDLYAEAEELAARGNLAAELEVYDQLVETDPENHAVFYNRGQILLELGRREEAAAALIEAVSLGMQQVDKSLQPEERGAAGIGGLAGLLAFLLRREVAAPSAPGYPDFIDDSEMLLERLLERLPDSVEILHCLASIARLKNRREAAEACYRRVLEIDPDDKVAWFNLGYMHSEKGGDAAPG